MDFKYVSRIGKVAQTNQAIYFSFISCYNASKSSLFKFQKYKGQAEDYLTSLSFPQLSIFQPYFIKNRNQKSKIEKVRNYIPYFGGSSGTECHVLAQIMLKCARDLLKMTIMDLDP